MSASFAILSLSSEEKKMCFTQATSSTLFSAVIALHISEKETNGNYYDK